MLDSLIYFLMRLSNVMAEYVNENGDNDPVEQVIALGEHLAEEFTSRITAAVSAAGFLTE